MVTYGAGGQARIDKECTCVREFHFFSGRACRCIDKERKFFTSYFDRWMLQSCGAQGFILETTHIKTKLCSFLALALAPPQVTCPDDAMDRNSSESAGPFFDRLPRDVVLKIGGHLRQSDDTPFLLELAYCFQDWLPSWGPERLFHILGEDRTHYQSPALQRFEQLRRRTRDLLAVSIHEL